MTSYKDMQDKKHTQNSGLEISYKMPIWKAEDTGGKH